MRSSPIRYLVLLLIAVFMLQQMETASAKPRRQRQARSAPRPKPPENKATHLNRLYREHWEESLRMNPLQATFQGDLRYNDQLPNFFSPAYRQQAHDFTIEWKQKAEAIGPDELEGQALLSYEIFIDDAQTALAGERFPTWMMPINQYNNIAVVLAFLGSGTNAQPFTTVKDYENWYARADHIPELFDQIMTNMRQGMNVGVIQSRPITETVLQQLDALIRPTPEETVFWMPVQNMPDDFPDADRQRLTEDYRSLIGNRVLPAYKKLRSFIASEYLPRTQAPTGLGALPDGAAWYTYAVHKNTTTDLAPERLHVLGVEEVKRIQDAIAQVASDAGFKGNWQRFGRNVQANRRLRFENAQSMLNYYQALQRTVESNIPAYFSLTPRVPLQTRTTDPGQTLTTSVSYLRPTQDGLQPGTLIIDATHPTEQAMWEADTLFLQEGIPGRHFQLALQQELSNLPKFRQFGGDVAFTGGWSLYASSLGADLGVYQTPYTRYGALQTQLWRALILVVDTGIHSQGWTHAQATRYLLENSTVNTAVARAEVERIVANPGQAVSQTIGELKIRELRAICERELGAAFDIRGFHAEILRDGSMPLRILERKIMRWVASQKSAMPISVDTRQDTQSLE